MTVAVALFDVLGFVFVTGRIHMFRYATVWCNWAFKIVWGYTCRVLEILSFMTGIVNVTSCRITISVSIVDKGSQKLKVVIMEQ